MSDAASSIGGGAASGAVSGTMIAPGWGTLIGGVAGAAGGAATYLGGASAARQKERAIKKWKHRRQQILDSLSKEQWNASEAQQGLLTDELNKFAPTASVDSHVAADFADPNATAGMDPEQAAAYQAALGQSTAVTDSRQVAGDEVRRRNAWLQTLNDNADATAAGGYVPRNNLRRRGFQSSVALADNDAELNGSRPSNSAYNLQLLGSLLSGGGNLAIKSSAMA